MIGFAFLVPDVKYNEAYISFLFTHPEWRGAGIATFMLYHLIQVIFLFYALMACQVIVRTWQANAIYNARIRHMAIAWCTSILGSVLSGHLQYTSCQPGQAHFPTNFNLKYK